MGEDRLIVGYDEGSKGDITVLTVGRVNSGGSITILNTYQGDEAEELYLKLTEYKSPVIPACLLSTIRKEE